MKANIGLIGLAVMGENLALNMESKGFTVAVYNRSVPGEEGVVDRFINGRGKSKRFIGTHSIEQLVDSVKSPHIIMMMVKAGRPVDELISQLLPFLSSGDVIIDGGNSDFHDTERRVKELEKKGIYFVGTGISGGEEGALHGPSVMPGGSVEAWPLVKDILQGISAKLDESGREVYRQHVDSQARLVTVDASALAPGTYFIRVVGKHEITVVKGVKR